MHRFGMNELYQVPILLELTWHSYVYYVWYVCTHVVLSIRCVFRFRKLRCVFFCITEGKGHFILNSLWVPTLSCHISSWDWEIKGEGKKGIAMRSRRKHQHVDKESCFDGVLPLHSWGEKVSVSSALSWHAYQRCAMQQLRTGRGCGRNESAESKESNLSMPSLPLLVGKMCSQLPFSTLS